MGLDKIDPTEHIKHFLSPTVAVSNNYFTATVTVSNNFGPTMRIKHFLSPTVAVSNMFGESRSILGREKTSPSHPELGRKFSSALSHAPAFSSVHKLDFGTVTEHADKIKRWFERTIPRFDSMKNRFERTIPRFDSEVVKTGVKICPTDGFKKVPPRILNNLGGPQHAENKTVQKNSFSKRDETFYILL